MAMAGGVTIDDEFELFSTLADCSDDVEAVECSTGNVTNRDSSVD